MGTPTYFTGSVGIGTDTPRSMLEVQVPAVQALGPVITVTNSVPAGAGSPGGAAAAIDLNPYPPPPSGTTTETVWGIPPRIGPDGPIPGKDPHTVTTTWTYNPCARIEAVSETADVFATDIVLLSNAGGKADAGLVERMRITPSGVGIGTSSPQTLLSLRQDSNTQTGIRIDNAIAGATLWLGNGSQDVFSVGLDSNSPGAQPFLWTATGQDLRIGVGASGEVIRVQESSGHVGIGTTAPASTLHVAGDITITKGNASGNISVAGDVLLTGADCAENFDTVEAALIDPGTVVVIDAEGALRQSRMPYDRKVAGVVSGAGDYRHGLLLDKRSSDEGRVPVALVGKVYCKVDAQQSPIEVGDLLTTSPTPGHAMKATEPTKAFGAVIGKALRALPSGSGLIPILVALQ